MTSTKPYSRRCRPRWAPPRTPSRKSLGNEVAIVAELLGTPLQPWQAQVADVALEMLPNGLPAYREIVVLVPRQSGKTSLCLALEVHRALKFGSPQNIAYTAQTGFEARKKLIDDQAPILMRSALSAAVEHVFRVSGGEGILFKGGSRINVVASSLSAGHGAVTDLAVLDESWMDLDDRREQALIPSMATRRAAQILIVSTAGYEGSVYLKRKVDAGRDAVTNGLTTGMAYFEWSAEDDDDPADRNAWRRCMPALGHTIDQSVVEHAFRTMNEDEFRRAFLNQWTTAEERVLPAALWNACNSADVAPAGGLMFGIDLNAERTAAAIVVADSSGRCEVIEAGLPVSRLIDRATEVALKQNTGVVLDARGPAGMFMPEIEAKGVKVYDYSFVQVAQACGRLFDAVADGQIAVRRHPRLDAAVAGARRRESGDAWMWSRKATSTDLSPLVALTLAYDKAKRANTVWMEFG